MEEQRKAVRAMQVYIREHITEDITPADLAKASNFSPWYARKLFMKLPISLSKTVLSDSIASFRASRETRKRP